MQENTNKAIAINSIILYGKLLVMMVTALLTTRFALQALGITDFGLFSVLGSIISFIAIFNTIMLSASNRFISIAIGKGVEKEINEQFNICLIIHIGIAIATLLVAIPAGDWYIYNYINFDGDINKAISVYHYSVIGSVISFIGVPYNGLLMAKERFIVFSITEIVTHIFKLAIAISIVYAFEEKLLIFAFSQAAMTAIPTVIYWLYCKRHFAPYVDFHVIKDKQKYKDIFNFSSWVAFGAFATVGKNQGAAVLVNAFFNTAMNTALGLASTVNGLITSFANNISQPMAPQITKSYAQGDRARCEELLVMSTKYTYLVMLCISAPFFVNPQWIFELWLGEVPSYVVEFTTLIIIDALITSLNSGISNIIFASGKIKWYQIIINTLRLVAISIAYIVLKVGGPAPSLLYAYIVMSIFIFIAGQLILHKTLEYDNSILIKQSYLPSVTVSVIFFILVYLNNFSWHPLVQLALFELLLVLIIVLIGLNGREQKYLFNLVKRKLK